MTIEEQLKDYIKSRYGNIRAFTLATGVSYANIDSMLRRGVEGVTWNTIQLVCKALNIDIDALAEGQIIPKKIEHIEQKDIAELISTPELLSAYLLDGKPLTITEERTLQTALEVAVGIIRSGRC